MSRKNRTGAKISKKVKQANDLFFAEKKYMFK